MAKHKIFENQKYTLKLFLILLFFHFSLFTLLPVPQAGDRFAQSITFQKAVIGPNIDYLQSVVQTPDNGYIAVGRKRTSFAEDGTYIIRFNVFGDTLWTKRINRGAATCVIKTNDDNYALCDVAGSFIKFDINGNILILGSFFNDNLGISKILQVNDGSYFMCGLAYTTIDYPYLSKYDQNGNFLWDSIYTLNGFSGLFSDFVKTDDNNLVLTGEYKLTPSGQTEILLLKLNQKGEEIWFTNHSTNFYVNIFCLTKTKNGSFIVGGVSIDAFLAKFNEKGVFQWRKYYDTTFSSHPNSITTSNDGGYVYTGFIDTGGAFVRVRKTDSNGVEIWRKIHGFENNNHSAWDIKTTSDSGFVIVGRTFFQLDDAYILKIDKNGVLFPIGIQVISEKIPQGFNLYQNYPNPFNPETKIRFDMPGGSNARLSVINILGQEISVLVNEKLSAGSYEIEFNAKNLSSGIYFYRLITDKYTQTKKMLLIK